MSDIESIADFTHASEPAFIGNRLLATFPPELRQTVRDQVEIIRLETGDTVLSKGDPVKSSVFPFGTTMISMIIDLADGRSVEVGGWFDIGHGVDLILLPRLDPKAGSGARRTCQHESAGKANA